MSRMLSDISLHLQQFSLLSVVARLGLSILIGGILGAERGIKNRPAGFMTHVLVCMGSALIMLTNLYVYRIMPGTDPTRFGAQVISGMGFLGAGTIMVTHKDEVRGLTTAAGLWVAAGFGLAAGAGFYSGALVGCLFYVFAIITLRKIDVYIKTHTRNIELYIEYSRALDLHALTDFARAHGYVMHSMQHSKVETLNAEYGTLSFALDLKKKTDHRQIMAAIENIKGVEYVREIAS